jgi:pimeloyl-ACP methyl ester carboxylesterase
VTGSVAARPFERPGLAERAAGVLRTEAGLARLAIGAMAVHVVDENFVQPNPGTSAGDHLASGLVPLAILVGAGVLYPRIRAGFRAALAMTLGLIGIAFGVSAVYYLQHGEASGDHYTGLLSLVAGVVLLVLAPVTLWRARRGDGPRWRRYGRRALGVAAVPLLVAFVVFPVGYSYGYTHMGKLPVTPDLGVPYDSVRLTTSDSLELAGSYVPSRNRAAVILFPGSTHSDHARMLVRHGYGVLMLDPRGQGHSEGDVVRWAGDRDLIAAAEYLRGRPDVDDGRIGAIGFSVGGEILIEAAAKSTGLSAVVSEGAGLPIGTGLEGDDASAPERLLYAPLAVAMRAATTVFSNHGQQPPIVDRIGRIAPRPVFLIYADPGSGGENTRQPDYYAAAGRPKAMWKVPGSTHTGGLDAQPAEYERRVVGFFDRALLQEGGKG